jgi:hypothetical protein
MTLAELADEFGVSRERVRQIEARAFEKVQEAVAQSSVAKYMVKRRGPKKSSGIQKQSKGMSACWETNQISFCQRARAAFRASSLRSSPVSCAIRALPPLKTLVATAI